MLYLLIYASYKNQINKLRFLNNDNSPTVLRVASSIQICHVKIKYSNLFAIEYEGSEDDPVAEVAETIGYAKGILKGMS